MTSRQAFRPEWASAPGETIADLLADQRLSVDDFARLMEYTPEEVRDLLEGRTSISVRIARRLAQTLGASVEFWMSRDYQYREDISRLHNAERDWLRDLPIGDMIRFGWLSPTPLPADETRACLAFFGVPSISAWRQVYGGLEHMAAFRTSRAFDSRPGSVAAWVRRGEVEAEQIETKPWDPRQFEASLEAVRHLTKRRDPRHFIPELQQCCAEAGVAVTVVRAPAGCRASGAVRFLTPSKALVQLSFRYLSDDQFWFTFFHEAGHLLLHRERISYLESLRGDSCGLLEGADPLSEEEEQQANEFAVRTLIPLEFRVGLENLRADPRAVIRFSVQVGVSPGIVVGQLQHLGRIAPNRLNMLKRRYRWDD